MHHRTCAPAQNEWSTASRIWTRGRNATWSTLDQGAKVSWAKRFPSLCPASRQQPLSDSSVGERTAKVLRYALKMAVRTCSVTITDARSVRHTVDVTAESLF